MEDFNDILAFHFSKYLVDDLGLSFYPYFIGREECKAKKATVWHNETDQYTFHYVISGTGYLLIDGKQIKLSADDVFFVSPNCNTEKKTVGYFPDKKDPWTYIWFNLVGDGVKNLLSAAKLEGEVSYYSIQNPTVLRQQLIEMISTAQNTPKRNASYYLPFVTKFFATLADERSIYMPLNNKAKKVKIILDYIEQNYALPSFGINEIASQMFYSVSYVSRIFKESTGMTPMEYATSLRMLKAMDFLRSGKYSVSQTAYLVGYNSPFYFSKEFKKYFGHSPSEFK